MDNNKRHFTAQQKVQILREHLIDKVPVSQLCQKHQIQPTLLYAWQKTFFENGTAAFERQWSRFRVSVEQKKLEQLEAKLQRKDEVLAELMTEHIMLKKVLGRPETQMGRARCARCDRGVHETLGRENRAADPAVGPDR